MLPAWSIAMFLTCRGGLHDFVKVLDFGLAKAVDDQKNANVTNPNALMGTPLYMSPEAVQQSTAVDARSDVYALGAVALFMLTASSVFTGATVMEICMKHVREQPEPPSARLGKPVSPTLEALIMRCLAKAPADRPKSAGDLLQELESCEVQGKWTAVDAAIYWLQPEKAAPNLAPTQVIDTPAPGATIVYSDSESSK
jgi:serine/threonine protein kinase